MNEMAYIRDGEAIYRRSFAIIRAEADLRRFSAEEADIAVRMIHAAGLVALADDIVFAPGVIAGARAALAAHEYATARAALAPHLAMPTRRVAALMAAIEEADHGETGRVREWMARAVRASGDPAWTADGVVSETWLPVTPTGHLDGFAWRVPLAEIGVHRPVVEILPADETAVEAATVEAAPAETVAAAKPPQTATDAAAPAAIEPKPARPQPVEPVIPLVHVPDDPGPGSGLEAEPEAAVPADGQRWRKIKDLFK